MFGFGSLYFSHSPTSYGIRRRKRGTRFMCNCQPLIQFHMWAIRNKIHLGKNYFNLNINKIFRKMVWIIHLFMKNLTNSKCLKQKKITEEHISILGQQEWKHNLQAMHSNPIAPILFVTLSKISPTCEGKYSLCNVLVRNLFFFFFSNVSCLF